MRTLIRNPLGATTLLLAALLLGGLTPTSAPAVSSADQICAPGEDPCVIDSVVLVDHLSVLDFGSRTVILTGNGELNTGAGTVTVLCGRFEASGLSGADPVAIRARGLSPLGSGTDGGTFELRAQRSCTENHDTTCLNDVGCDFGLCTAHVCTGDAGRGCQTDAACDIGPCNINRNTGISRCGATSVQCQTDGDCRLGTCDLGTTLCSGSFDRECTEDVDCDDGQCLVGHGEVDIDGRIRGDGQVAGSVTILAAGDIHIRQEISLAASVADEDGGVLQIVSRLGDVVIDGKLTGTGGGESQGGDFAISAGRDLLLTGDINVSGGEFDGGFFDVDADRDITVVADVLASAVARDGYGGEIAVLAGRDINVPGPAAWRTNGSRTVDGFCGEAGAQELDAARNLNIGPGVVLQANGPGPDCGGEEISLTAGNDAFIAGEFESRAAETSQGSGGSVLLTTGRSAIFTDTSQIDVRGGNDGGGEVDVTAQNDLFFDGRVVATASGAGSGDAISLLSECLLSVGGDLDIGGSGALGINGTIDIDGGDVVIATGASLVNTGDASENLIRGSEFVTIEAGAVVSADVTTGTNQITYRNAAAPPVINGSVSPVAVLVLNEAIPRAACVCGNGIIENGETCDDRNRTSGDGCSSACQAEACVAATSGYPAVPLCDDDNDCTVDSCNLTTRTCQHVLNCDDGVACTIDTCGAGGVCRHTPDDGLCNDGDLCTENLCAENIGCILTFTTSACNDGISCTGSDVCDRGICLGTSNCPAGALCDLELGQCVESVSCGNGAIEPPEQCDDGDTVWADGQFCDAGCEILACGDPNDSGGNANASDALFVLRSAVSLATCDPCICNVDSSAGAVPVTASDALRTLQAAVGVPVVLSCPVCV